MLFYTSDLHLGHQRVLELSRRPFSTIEEHENFIIDNWNGTVSDKDTIYIVGDISYRSKVDIGVYLKKLKGNKKLIIGNHDLLYKYINYENIKCFKSIEQLSMVQDGEYKIVLCHYHLLEWLF